jgi:starch synthase
VTEETLSVLMTASEVAPLASTGGLAEVTGSLPLALRDAGLKVAVAMPGYRCVLDKLPNLEKAAEVPVRVGNLYLTAEVLRGELAPGVPLYVVCRDEFFDRENLYVGRQGEYFDNPERFVFFSRAVPAFLSAVGWTPDVIHGNDWQSGLIMPLLNLGALPRTVGVMTVHNQGYLGLAPPDRTHIIGLPDRFYTMEGLEYYGQMSLLKAGIVYAEAVTTVSPTYAMEVQTPEGGHGLDGVMRSVSHRLFGILNGVDYRVWNPETDRHIAAKYSSEDLAGKAVCKRDLLDRFGLSHLEDKPIIGLVTRLTAQKGVNLLSEAAEDLFNLGAGLIVLGTGDEWHENLMARLKEQYPDRVALAVGFDPVLAHRIIAGSDMLLMPSMYEPCGLAQMFSLKYGTVPIVRATGGLNDTIVDLEENGLGTGFKFRRFHSKALARAARRAVELHKNPEGWRKMMLNGMAQDFSWDRSAREYLKVYEFAAAAKRGGGVLP